jgi:hypothetical protein
MCPAFANATNAKLPAPLPALLVHPESEPSEAVKLLIDALEYSLEKEVSSASTTREQPMKFTTAHQLDLLG